MLADALNPRQWRRRRRTEFWALSDVTFDVPQGEVIGVIGRNGAGKSTLLKILSRITEPTTGTATIWGRVGSLLEVGTGFHQELTGRENIYLNGAILGMRRAEITSKFDEIVEFSEIDKFIDTPVKHYSSGMYVRLAFAVAAHLEPEVLIVDEVLAVGDLAFQRKCLGKISEVASAGRTVLFVSHNMSAVQRLCTSCVLLENGKIVSQGSASSVIDAYYRASTEEGEGVSERTVHRGDIRFQDWHATEDGQDRGQSVYSGSPCQLYFRLISRRTVAHAIFGIAIWTLDGTLVWAMRNIDDGNPPVDLDEGIHIGVVDLPILPVRPGSYQLQVSVNSAAEGLLDMWHPADKLNVLARRATDLPEKWQGLVSVPGRFGIETLRSVSGVGEP